MVQDVKSLDGLWECVHDLNKKHFPENDLMPVLGNGKVYKPKIMFVFINPTHLNISSEKVGMDQGFHSLEQKLFGKFFIRLGCLMMS